jgi:CelD/BcsL family acetyltransferase involved in cellulose biosynthesis
LPGFFEAHVARYQAMQRTSIFSSPERRLLLEELARRFSGTEVVTMSVLMIGDRPVAWNYGFQFHGVWSLYQPTFDIRCEDYSPGYCLTARIVIEACETSRLNVVDLGLGSEGYKEWFANSTRQTLHVTLTTSPLRHWREIATYRIATEVKRFPKLEAAIRNARSRLRQ